jgi:protein-disulfide isomerase
MKSLAGALLGLSAVAVAALVMVSACGGDDDGGDKPPAGTSATAGSASTVPAKGDPAAAFRALTVPDDLTDGFEAGKADAKVTLEMFEDFQCPHCLSFTLQFEPLLFEEYVVPGKVRLVFRNLPILGPESANAAIAGTCASAQDRFWPYQKELFLAQADAGQLTDEQLDKGRFALQPLRMMADRAGIDAVAFDACMQDEATVARVNDDIRAAQAAGFRGTPSFLLNGKAVAAPADAAGWRKLLDGALAGN